MQWAVTTAATAAAVPMTRRDLIAGLDQNGILSVLLSLPTEKIPGVVDAERWVIKNKVQVSEVPSAKKAKKANKFQYSL